MSTQNRGAPAGEPEPLGLRERKKRETRLAISDVATRMFIDRGFENVTVAEVAATAGVSVNTVFNYFPTKEDLFFDHAPEVEEQIVRAVVERRRGESAVAALRRLFRRALKAADPAFSDADVARFFATMEASPALKAKARVLHEKTMARLTSTLATETGAPPDDPTAHAVAAMIMGVWWMIMEEHHRRALAGEPHRAAHAAMSKIAERSFELLLRAAGDYCVRPRTDHAEAGDAAGD